MGFVRSGQAAGFWASFLLLLNILIYIGFKFDNPRSFVPLAREMEYKSILQFKWALEDFYIYPFFW